ncbi:c-type cytochrome domain-containing protein [Algoriphagus namhaensis]|uniref:C-type cytochrome domain-containing protein n=1 Tax=Algoriphagus namhaensis TaxID=915353 RepID=A0ABV8AMZ9_9BACT
MYVLLQSDATLFLGRFHSLTVHLPIGFLLLAVLIFFISYFKRFEFLLKALPLTLFLGVLSAIASVVLGLFLAEEGGYPEDSLFWHRLMGIVVAVLSVAALLLILGFFNKKKKVHSLASRLQIGEMEKGILEKKSSLAILFSAIIVCISITGHLGGNLTHGEDYLFAYAPEPIQELFSSGEEQNALSFPEDSDSTLLFEHILGPVINQKCASCHNSEVQKGGLMVTSLEELIEGGESGPALSEGSPESSELFKRVTMDPKSRKYMPPKGAGLSYGEITLLNYWIKNGMGGDLAVTDEEIPEEIQSILASDFGLSTKRKAHYEKIKVEKVPEETLAGLKSEGFRISTLSEENNFLEVVATGKLTKENLDALLEISEQITWLDLGNSGIEDSWLSVLSDFPNLTRLVLDNNQIGDQVSKALANLDHLESINLYNTSVGDSTLEVIAQIKSLRTAYLWNTKVSKDLVAKFNESNPKLKIDSGVMGSNKEEE